MTKIQGYQFSIDMTDNGMTRSLRTIRDEAKLLKSAMQANFAEIRSGEGIMAAYANKAEDAKRAIEGQRNYIERLKKEQDGLDLTTEKGRQAYIKFENQINSAKRTIANLESQEKQAANSLELHRSGILRLKDALETTEKINKNYVEQLKNAGMKYTAQKAQIKGLIDTQKVLETQLQAEKKLLVQVEQTSGKASKTYRDQAIKLSELSRKYIENQREISGSNKLVLKMNDSLLESRDRLVAVGKTAKETFGNDLKRAAEVTGAALTGIAKMSYEGAKKATEVSSQYKVIYNNLVTGGESAAEATKKVKEMQEDGAKYSIKYGVSQKEVADGYLELVKRGYSSSQALGAMNTELQGSIASGDDFNDVVKVASGTLEAFGMNAKSATEMTKNTKLAVNELAYTADTTATDFHGIGKAMEYVGTTSHQAGFKLSETSAALGTLSKQNIDADKALVKLAA
ncbi:phage tail tape measure protein [Ligilactobacillus faecis]|uniref:phage tail tape measure protein n=1 Tax=Ligilactobacillus faecis TaxID=762833 RepID=UPI0024695E1C|nr:phage tail tape measure protein [Ligilactobacillus faecis]WGN89039.1 phage tail tape measure protein [Ligilactobacillus faecis]